MPRVRTTSSSAKRAAALLAAGALLASVVVAGLPAHGVAAAVTAIPTATAEELPATPVNRLVLDGTVVTLTAAQAATTLGSGTLDYSVGINPSETAQSMRLQVSAYNERNVLVHQRTRFVNNIQQQAEAAREDQEARDSNGAGARSAAAPLLVERFERELSEITATPGVWTIRVDVVLSSRDGLTEGQLTELLTVYDESAAAADLVTVLRITAPPLRSPDGVFVIDPASPAQAQLRTNLQAALRWLEATPNVNLTIAISPLLVDEWRDASDGYEVPSVVTVDNGAAGEAAEDEPQAATTAYPAESEAAQSCAAVLAELQAAVDAGKLTVTALGYADPSLTELSAADRTSDIRPQYDRGYTALAGLATETVSAPLAETINRSAVTALAASGVEVLILPDSAVVQSESADAADVGIGAVDARPAPVAAIISSTALSDIIAGIVRPGFVGPSASTSATPTNGTAASTETARVAQLYRALPPSRVTAATFDLAEQTGGAATLLSTLTAVAELPWASLVSPTSATPTATMLLELQPLEPPSDTGSATENREAVATARETSTAYLSLAPESPSAQSAYDSGLVAQNAVDVGAAAPSLADATRLEHATYAANTAQAVFDAVSIEVQAVTLPSAEGPVPITIRNTSGEVLTAELSLTPSEGLGIVGDESTRQVEIPPQETFLNPTIRLYGVSSGELTVRLAADGYTISQQTIRVSASYIETVATIAAVTFLGFALVAYIWRRTQRVAAEDADQILGGGPE